MDINYDCDCRYRENCRYVKKLEEAIEELEFDYASIGMFDYIEIDPSNKRFWNGDISESEYCFRVSCGLLKNYSFDHLKWVATRMYFQNKLNELDEIYEEDEERDPEDSWEEDEDEWEASEWDDDGDVDNLTRAISRLGQKGEKIKYPVEIIQSNDINGFANSETGKIQITSAAIDSLSEEEIAFILAHEEAHLDRKHAQAKQELSSLTEKHMKEVLSDEKTGLVKKIVGAAALTTVAVAAGVATSKLLELDADIEAQRRMKEAGYSHDDTLKFTERLDQRGNLISTHPSGKTRKKMLE
jgi:hypothetical protein